MALAVVVGRSRKVWRKHVFYMLISLLTCRTILENPPPRRGTVKQPWESLQSGDELYATEPALRGQRLELIALQSAPCSLPRPGLWAVPFDHANPSGHARDSRSTLAPLRVSQPAENTTPNVKLSYSNVFSYSHSYLQTRTGIAIAPATHNIPHPPAHNNIIEPIQPYTDSLSSCDPSCPQARQDFDIDRGSAQPNPHRYYPIYHPSGYQQNSYVVGLPSFTDHSVAESHLRHANNANHAPITARQQVTYLLAYAQITRQSTHNPLLPTPPALSLLNACERSRPFSWHSSKEPISHLHTHDLIASGPMYANKAGPSRKKDLSSLFAACTPGGTDDC